MIFHWVSHDGYQYYTTLVAMEEYRYFKQDGRGNHNGNHTFLKSKDTSVLKFHYMAIRKYELSSVIKISISMK